MYRLLLLGTAAALTAVTSPAIPAASPNPPTACELLSAAEVARFLGAPSVRIDSINSGNNELTQVEGDAGRHGQAGGATAVAATDLRRI